MQPTVHIRDELVLEGRLDTDETHILIRREGEPGTVRVYLGDVRWARWRQRRQGGWWETRMTR